jgi:hypothetical protein
MAAEDVSPLRQAAHFLDALVYFTHENMPLLCEINRNGERSGDHSAPYFWLHLTISGLLSKAQSQGEIAQEADPVALADMILAAASPGTIRLLLERGVSLERIGAGVQALTLGLGHDQG